jgi:EmrB/QacA subfamily drug resistance transporter
MQHFFSAKENKNIILFVVALSSFIAPFMTSSINISLPSIEREFIVDAIKLNWITSSYILSAAVFLVPAGKLADIYGRKRFFNLGIFIYLAATIMASVSQSAMTLILARIVQGIGSAAVFSTNIAILTSVFPPEKRGRVLGINVSAVYIGLSSGPFLGGIMTEHFGWRSIFLFQIPLCLIILIFAYQHIKTEWADAKSEKFDLSGSITYILSILLILLGFSAVPTIKSIIFLSAGFLLLAIFYYVERKVSSPVINFNIFINNITFTFSSLAAFINYTSTFAISFLMSLYLQYIKGISPQQAGLVLLSQPIMMTLFSPFAGKLSDKIEPRIIASIGMGLMTAGLFYFSTISDSTEILSIVAILMLIGFGFALFSSPNTNAIMSSVDKKHYGIASAIFGTMRLTGQMFSMAIVIVVFSVFIGKVRIMPEHYTLFIKCLKILFTMFAILNFSGIFASLARGKIKRDN